MVEEGEMKEKKEQGRVLEEDRRDEGGEGAR